jgi:uncharacterized protein YcfL
MKIFDMHTKLLIAVLLFFACGCRTVNPIILTPEQEAVMIMNGDQNTTLELYKTHHSLSVQTCTSEYQARDVAVRLNADVAQLIYFKSTNGIVTSRTYRFWRIKSD